jgi:hypothetical protein
VGAHCRGDDVITLVWSPVPRLARPDLALLQPQAVSHGDDGLCSAGDAAMPRKHGQVAAPLT